MAARKDKPTQMAYFDSSIKEAEELIQQVKRHIEETDPFLAEMRHLAAAIVKGLGFVKRL